MTLWVACDRNTTQSCLNRPRNLLGHRIEVPKEGLRVKLDQGLERYMRDSSSLWSDQPSLCAQVWGASWAWDLPCWSQGSPSLVWTGHSICLSACHWVDFIQFAPPHVVSERLRSSSSCLLLTAGTPERKESFSFLIVPATVQGSRQIGPARSKSLSLNKPGTGRMLTSFSWVTFSPSS